MAQLYSEVQCICLGIFCLGKFLHCLCNDVIVSKIIL